MALQGDSYEMQYRTLSTWNKYKLDNYLLHLLNSQNHRVHIYSFTKLRKTSKSLMKEYKVAAIQQ